MMVAALTNRVIQNLNTFYQAHSEQLNLLNNPSSVLQLPFPSIQEVDRIPVENFSFSFFGRTKVNAVVEKLAALKYGKMLL